MSQALRSIYSGISATQHVRAYCAISNFDLVTYRVGHPFLTQSLFEFAIFRLMEASLWSDHDGW